MRHKQKWLGLALVLLTILAWPSLMVAAPKAEFPEPVGLVNDFADVLAVQERDAILRIAEQLWQSNGVELAVVTIADSYPLDTNTYAFRLFRAWGIGEEKADNGLLVLLNVGERDVRIEVGTGLEGYVNDAKAGRILDRGLPDLQANRYGQGLLLISQELATAVREAPGEGKSLGDDLLQMSPIGALLLTYIGLIIFAALFRMNGLLYFLLRFPGMFLGGSRGGRGGRGGYGGWGGGGGGFGGFGGGRSSGGGASRKF